MQIDEGTDLPKEPSRSLTTIFIGDGFGLGPHSSSGGGAGGGGGGPGATDVTAGGVQVTAGGVNVVATH